MGCRVMTEEHRGFSPIKTPGPYLAKVVNHLDSSYMGALEVVVIKYINGVPTTASAAISVQYLSPFYGVSSVKFEGNDSSNFNDVQKSYGMWMVPPDIGSTVMVIFVDAKTNQGYWFGCVQDQFQNHMMPGIAASRYSAMTPEQLTKYGTDYVPVAEYHKKSQTLANPNIDTLKKPVHPFADRLLQQGLLTDTIRGVTSSSARREVPSGVFGISTPGPIDKESPLKQAGFEKGGKLFSLPVSRLGGTQFVMDDGDKDGQNELVRIRTRTGHQILMHNSSDLIYIANSKGTAWIELTSNGKIDIYAQDSVSIHTEQDFNFRADKDINIEAGRNMNISVGGDYHLDTVGKFIVNSAQSGFITMQSNLDVKVGSTAHYESASETHIKGSNLYVTAAGTIDVLATGGEMRLRSGGKMSQSATGNWSVSATGDTNISAAGNHKETATQIHMNGPTADPANGAGSADAATPAVALPTYSLPNRDQSMGWANKNFYKASDIISIMKRVPTHEPWDQHENINPAQFSTDATDLGNSAGPQSAKQPSVDYKVPPAVKGTPPEKTGNVEEDNIAAFLWTIRVCEGTSGPTGYNTMFTGKQFESFADHPRQAITAGVNGKGLTSTAAGAYQFLSSTWDQCQRSLTLPDFSPASQDKACILLLKQARALDYIRAGDFTNAIKRTNKIWASLPGSPYNQHPKDLSTAVAYYQQGGGTVTA